MEKDKCWWINVYVDSSGEIRIVNRVFNSRSEAEISAITLSTLSDAIEKIQIIEVVAARFFESK